MTAEQPVAVVALGQVAQPVTDLGRAVAFYRDVLGLRHVASFEPPGLAFFDLDGTRLMLDALTAEQAGGGSPLYLRVNDLDGAAAALASRGVSLEQEPHLIQRDERGDFGPAGVETWMAFFRDPDGNLLALMSERG